MENHIFEISCEKFGQDEKIMRFKIPWIREALNR